MNVIVEVNGSALLDFEDSKEGSFCEEQLITLKNRLCCPEDESPLITMLSKNVKNYEFEITCKSCNKIYKRKENLLK